MTITAKEAFELGRLARQSSPTYKYAFIHIYSTPFCLACQWENGWWMEDDLLTRMEPN